MLSIAHGRNRDSSRCICRVGLDFITGGDPVVVVLKGPEFPFVSITINYRSFTFTQQYE